MTGRLDSAKQDKAVYTPSSSEEALVGLTGDMGQCKAGSGDVTDRLIVGVDFGTTFSG